MSSLFANVMTQTKHIDDFLHRPLSVLAIVIKRIDVSSTNAYERSDVSSADAMKIGDKAMEAAHGTVRRTRHQLVLNGPINI